MCESIFIHFLDLNLYLTLIQALLFLFIFYLLLFFFLFLFYFLQSVLLAAVLCDNMLCKQDELCKISKIYSIFLL